MPKQIRSYIHVIIQFGIIFYLFFTGPVFASGFLLGIEIAGIFLGLWAIWLMRHSYLSIFPEPDSKFKLIEKGPYRIIRHPMYTALFLSLIPLVVEFPDTLRIFVMILFIINQIFKLLYEERLIENYIPEYLEYKKRTWRVLPYIY